FTDKGNTSSKPQGSETFDEGARDALVSPSETIASISPRTESVYLPTTVPIGVTPKIPSSMSQRPSETSSLTSGDFNELGIPSQPQPVASPQRWLPRQQRELLQKQAEISDTESADLKQTKLKKYQINFEGLFKKKPQKVVTVAKTDPEAPVEDPNDDAAPSEATVIIEDDPPKAGEKNLVYAELMLKPSEDGHNPNKNATEYAEIVYVNPPSDQKQPDKK
ncbi:hypothetical protein Bhyg_00936, partial [Pseudolycoriella hygida]